MEGRKDQANAERIQDMNWDTIFQIVVVVASSSALGIAIKAFADRPKMKVDSNAVQIDTAIKQANAASQDVDEMKEEIRKFRNALRNHELWDRRVQRQLEQAGIEIEPPPELFWL